MTFYYLKNVRYRVSNPPNYKKIVFLFYSNMSYILSNPVIRSFYGKFPTADTDLLKMVPVKILLNFGNYFRTLQLRFSKFLSGIVFLHYAL